MRYMLPPTGVVAQPTRRVSYNETRIVGIVVDKARMYVAVWRSGRIFNLRAKRLGGSLSLSVFWLEDGSRIDDVALPMKAVPAKVPAETIEAGPLQSREYGVSLFGQTYRYEGRLRK